MRLRNSIVNKYIVVGIITKKKKKDEITSKRKNTIAARATSLDRNSITNKTSTADALVRPFGIHAQRV